VPADADVFVDGVSVGKVRSDITMTFKSKTEEGACTVPQSGGLASWTE
jgi:hypothetical protein